MDSPVSPETREVSGLHRPWETGAQGPRNDGNRGATAQGHHPMFDYQTPNSPSSAYIDVHHRSIQSAYGNKIIRQVQRSPSPIPADEPSGASSPSPNASTTRLNAALDKDPARPQLVRASTTFYDRIISDWWWWELFSWLVAFASVSAIVGVLAFYDGKKQPQYIVPGITLNAYISVFAAIAKAALILPVSEAIGQLKWMWFQKEAKLWDFYTFDNASRGPWGSLMLLTTTKGRHLVSLGAVITILALAFEPFFQQIVSFKPREVVSGTSTVSVAKTYFPFNDNFWIVDTDYSQKSMEGRSMQLAVSNSMSSVNSTVEQAPTICPSGRCNWTSYSSLGVCHSCEDLSNSLEYVCRNHTTDILRVQGSVILNPCGYVFKKTFMTGYTRTFNGRHFTSLSTMVVGDPVDRSEPALWNSTAYDNITNSIIKFYVGYTPGGAAQAPLNFTPVLKECMLQWCVKSFEASYDSGSLNERLVSTVIRPYLPSLPGQNSSLNMAFDIETNGTLYQIPENTTNIMVSAIRSNLPVEMSGDADVTGDLPGMWSFLQHQPYDFERYLTKVTDAMTNNLRSQPNEGTVDAQGQAWTEEHFVEIRWFWITLPGVLLFGTFIFVCSTILKARHHDSAAWKSSALATLLHGLAEESRDQFNPKASQSEIEAVSQRTRVMLQSRNGSTRLVLV